MIHEESAHSSSNNAWDCLAFGNKRGIIKGRGVTLFPGAVLHVEIQIISPACYEATVMVIQLQNTRISSRNTFGSFPDISLICGF